ncbi:hypothetical protein [Embleya sp. NPDC050493]|uniref:hypothetical protein n=1 Tax=Embleya sp. NPDC050493 TaxID=3363989 RepID=UPI00378F00C5
MTRARTRALSPLRIAGHDVDRRMFLRGAAVGAPAACGVPSAYVRESKRGGPDRSADVRITHHHLAARSDIQ